jgi:hypothetical protein
MLYWDPSRKQRTHTLPLKSNEMKPSERVRDSAGLAQKPQPTKNGYPVWGANLEAHKVPEMVAIYKEFRDVITDAVPTGLPAERDLTHSIEIVPGSNPPHWLAHRTDAKKKAIIKESPKMIGKQEAIFFARGHILRKRPYSSQEAIIFASLGHPMGRRRCW